MLVSLAHGVSGSGWAYAVVLLLAFLDSFFPLVPDETAVITAGVLAAAGELRLEFVVAAAGTGVVLGDSFTYGLGSVLGQRVFSRGERARRIMTRAENTLAERRGMLVVVARFVPGGRTATTFTCGVTGFPWRTYLMFSGLGGSLWAIYESSLGYVGGTAFRQHAWEGLMMAFTVAAGVAVALKLLRCLR
jgi:membrane protein DedA with SNARE-associated domain